MNSTFSCLPIIALLATGYLSTVADAAPPVNPSELVAPKIAIVGGNVHLTVSPSVSGRRYQAQRSDALANGGWVNVGVESVGNGGALVIPIAYEPGVPKRFYRLALDPGPLVPEGFALIPAGNFQMGDQSNPLVGDTGELPVHTVYVSAFFMAKYEVTKELWDSVRSWGLSNGYTDLAAGGGKAADHPVYSVNWYDIVKWCNARSEMEGLAPCYTVSNATYKTGSSIPTCNWSANGYRLPTEAEWEKAARGGVSGKNFPWGTDTISHVQANFWNFGDEPYQTGTTGRHPVYGVNPQPWTSPVGSFAPNGYGLCDMAGNVFEWCWDRYAFNYYALSPSTDPRGSSTGTSRMARGGYWGNAATFCRVAYRIWWSPGDSDNGRGFRLARSSSP